MDVSILAAVGSFVVSERVLKPKATLFVILGCVLVYDLSTKTGDISSLRVYRGPGLLAFTLMMVAYSLRTWRRNGVACDELLFLPGTPHGEYHGIDAAESSTSQQSQSAMMSSSFSSSSSSSSFSDEEERRRQKQKQQPKHKQSEGDIAAGAAAGAGRGSASSPITTITGTNPIRNRNVSNDSSSDEDGREDEECGITDNRNDTEMVPISPPQTQRRPRSQSRDGSSSADSAAGGGRHGGSNHNSSDTEGSDGEVVADTSSGCQQQSAIQRFRQNHPRIARIGSFFFFRDSRSQTQSAVYAPSGPTVVGAALDLSMPTLFNFHLFIEAFNHMGDSSKMLPLIFLTVLIIRSCIPPKRRGRFWSTIKITAMAPFYRIRFRDIFIGDVLTSLVRPLQDVLFALAYYFTVIYGTLTGTYGLNRSGEILEESWVLHRIFLPACALLPLWFRFLQTLRQCYDTGKRWPNLGNAFKYLSAALVIIHGMTHSEATWSPTWRCCFLFTLSYQIVWDTVMDWELFVIASRQEDNSNLENSCLWTTSRHRNIFQPIRDSIAFLFRILRSVRHAQLRPRRLYKKESFYWIVFAYNAVMRFTWMLCFIPGLPLLPSAKKSESPHASDTATYFGFILPLSEILRRTLWGCLYLEMKTIKIMDEDLTYARLEASTNCDDDFVSDASGVSTELVDSRKPFIQRSFLPTWLSNQQQLQHEAATNTSAANNRCRQLLNISECKCNFETRSKLFIAELSLWAVAFVGFGLWVAYS